jgi:hypothetical protein
MRKLVQDVMALRENPLTAAQVDEIFEDAWPRLEAQVNRAKQQLPDVQSPPRSMEEMLEEVLEGVRRIEREQSRRNIVQPRRTQGFVTSGFGARAEASDEAGASDDVDSPAASVARDPAIQRLLQATNRIPQPYPDPS